MARTIQRTRLQDFIVTSGDVVRGEDGASPTDLLVRAGDPDGTTAGANIEARGGDGVLATSGGTALFRAGDGGPSGGDGGVAVFRAGDGVIGGDGEVRAGNGTAGRGGNLAVRGGNGVTGGSLMFDGGTGTGSSGGPVTITGGSGPTAGGSITLLAGAGSTGGNVSVTGGTGATNGGDLTFTGGDDTGTSGNGGDITLAAGATTNVGSLGDGGSVILSPGLAAGSGSNGSIVLDYATWPASDGSPGFVLSTNGFGVLSWVAGGGGGESLAATLAIGNSTNGTAIITADSAAATPNTLVFTGGSHTGAVGASNGADVTLTSGSTNSTGDGGGVTITAGDAVSGAGGTAIMQGGDSTSGIAGSAIVKTTGPLPSFGRGPFSGALLVGTEDSATTGLGGWVLVEKATGSRGSNLDLQAGDAAVSSGVAGGSIVIQAGDGDGAGFGGDASLRAGDSSSTGAGGGLNLKAGNGGTPGTLIIDGGSGIGTSVGGDVLINGGSGATGFAGGDVRLSGGFSTVTTGLIGIDSPTDRDGTGFKFGSLSVTTGSGAASVVFATPFPAGPPLVIEVGWVFTGAGAPATLPPGPVVVHSVGPTGFSLSWVPFGIAAPPPYDIHWTARQ